MLDKIYIKYAEKLDHEQIKELVMLEIEVEIKRQLKEDVSEIIKCLSVSQLLSLKAEVSSGMIDTGIEEVVSNEPGKEVRRKGKRR